MAGADPEADTGSAPKRRYTWRRIAAAATTLVVIWLATAAWMLATAANEARAARGEIDSFRTAQPTDLLEGDLDERIDRAAAHLGTAEGRTGSIWVAPLKVLPVIGRQVRSADALASTGHHALTVASTALTDTRALLDGPLAQGADRVRVLDELRTVATTARSALGSPDLGPREALVGPLRDARQDLDQELARVTEVLDDAVTSTTGLTDLLRGPHDYLLVAANNAEMRAGSGFFGSMGVLTTESGTFRVDRVQAASDVLPPEGAVTAEGDLGARWGWLRPTDDFRNLGVSPRFDETARHAAAMWAAGGHDPVVGVLAVDPVFLEGLLDATGPVGVDGLTFTADDVVAYLLNGQYDDITDFEAGSNYDARKNYLSLVTAEILASLNGDGLDAPDLAEGVRKAARGRHLLAWSSIPGHQAAWQALGVDGALGADSLMVSVVNRGAVKLDWFVDIDAAVTLEGAEGPENTTAVTVDVQLRNEAPLQGSPYVLGPNPFLDIDVGHEVVEGEYVGVLAVTIPGGATDITLEGADLLATSGPDGPTIVAMAMVDVPRRETHHYTLRFTIPGDSLRVEPDARYPRIDWDLDGRPSSDGQGHTVTRR